MEWIGRAEISIAQIVKFSPRGYVERHLSPTLCCAFRVPCPTGGERDLKLSSTQSPSPLVGEGAVPKLAEFTGLVSTGYNLTENPQVIYAYSIFWEYCVPEPISELLKSEIARLQLQACCD